MNKKPQIIIIGGGLSGLTNAILLVKAGFEITLIERKRYPFHRVCGEYVSNEVLPLLKSIGLNVVDLGASKISKLVVTAPNGNALKADLDLGAFGISRYTLDFELYKIASALGVKFSEDTKVLDIRFSDEKFEVETTDKTFYSDLVIGAFGKRSNLDQKLNRKFFYQRSPYVGVKYHIKTDFPEDTIQLDNFKGGYCGLNKIDNDAYCLCYLAENKYLKAFGSISLMEGNIVKQNPHLKHVFNNSTFVWDKPETINEISFEQKSLIEDHIIMCGDTAGMIAPLCGNGMAIAIHSAKILANLIIKTCSEGINPDKRKILEQKYQQEWNSEFAFRLKTGRAIQHLFGHHFLTQTAIAALKMFPSLAKQIVKKTHGQPF